MVALLREQLQRPLVQRHAVVAAGLHLVRVQPGHGAVDVDLIPRKQPDVALPQARGRCEGGHRGQVRRQLGQQVRGLLLRQPRDALGRLRRAMLGSRQWNFHGGYWNEGPC
ncbi:MAG: hypothetical protein ABIX12_01105 [Rubrivivax sp.]